MIKVKIAYKNNSDAGVAISKVQCIFMGLIEQ